MGNFARDESDDVLLARTLVAQCLLIEAKYQEAKEEAEKILFYQRYNLAALLVKAESLYFLCKVSLQCKKLKSSTFYWSKL